MRFGAVERAARISSSNTNSGTTCRPRRRPPQRRLVGDAQVAGEDDDRGAHAAGARTVASSAQARSAMPGQREQLRSLAAPERMAVATDEHRGPVAGERGDREVVGPGVPSATSGDAAKTGDERLEHRTHPARRRPSAVSTVAVGEQRAPVGEELAPDVRDQRSPAARDRSAAHRRAADSERVEARIGEVLDRAHLLDAGAVDLLDLADEQVERAPRAQHHRELVDGDPSPCSRTSMPTMSPSTAPMRDATRPSAPGRSGSQTRTRTWNRRSSRDAAYGGR